jgi:hypothetical protein
MDEYTADPKETEREAQRVLRQMKNDKARAEVADIAEKTRAERIANNQYTKNFSGNTRGGGSGAGGTAADMKMLLNPKAMKKGGKVSSASKRADGIAIRGKTRI